jgi:transposase
MSCGQMRRFYRNTKISSFCERGFRFLKDPLFFASRMFVKLPKRVAALAMFMGLCLLVYSLGQRQLRQALAEVNETVHNQRGKPTELCLTHIS